MVWEAHRILAWEFSFWGVFIWLSTSYDTWTFFGTCWCYAGNASLWPGFADTIPAWLHAKTRACLHSPQAMQNNEGNLPSPSMYKEYKHKNLKKDKLESGHLLCTRSLQQVSASSELPAMICDTNYPELSQTSPTKGTFLHNTAYIPDTRCMFAVPGPPFLLISWVSIPMNALGFDNSLELILL